jgi:tetratricopeptide (TPR) repeat protein
MRRSPGPLGRMAAGLVMFAAGSAACAPGANHERIGDRRYAEGAWSDAVAEYRLAARQRKATPELRAKLGAAALRAGALEEAASVWYGLAGSEPAARIEAIEALMRVARQAVQVRNVRALRVAIAGLRELAPERVGELGAALVLGLDSEQRGRGDEDLVLIAAARTPRPGADSLLLIWADLVQRLGRCYEAVPAYEAVIRRGGSVLARAARSGLSVCRYEEGRELLGQGRLEDAEAAFRAAIALAGPDSLLRLSWLLIGDVRWAAGDSAAAATAYGRVVQGGDPGSEAVRRAEEQLRRLLGGNINEP